MADQKTWSGSPDPFDPANYWIDDDTGERVSALTGKRRPLSAFCPTCGSPEVTAITKWVAHSVDDPENVCELTEHQCTPCNGRSFWQ